ncbi:MAG TPA: rhomboid family intramembrane serine protease [Gammaproteobacteria bacterium]|nr:rhomboid family intramembrane serine protease [Gammaproteobacteria bacterium]
MFIPLDRKPDWRSPPVVTLLLISLNILVFTFFQDQDALREEDARRYYFSSGLAELEIPRYLHYLREHDIASPASVDLDNLDPRSKKRLYRHLLGNGAFLLALRNGRIITPGEPDYEHWRGLRRSYDSRLQNIFSYRFALLPYQPDAFRVLTALFLHANASHLLGNMVFLLLFGFILELSLGGPLLLLIYLACGISANLITLALIPDSGQWILGASGAITGLAGIYAVLFGRRRIRFFYSLIVYFDYVRAPAILMLPVWLLYEFVYTLVDPGSVSTVTHVGGLLCGIITGAALKYSPLGMQAENRRQQTQQDFEERFQEARRALAAAQPDKAERILTQLQEQRPDDSRVLEKRFQIARARADHTQAAALLRELLARDAGDPESRQRQQRCFLDYLQLAGKAAELPDDLLADAGLRFARGGFLDSSEQALTRLLGQNPRHARIPALLALLATRHHKAGSVEKSRRYKELLLRHFGDSEEARHIRQTLPSL